MEKQPHFLDTYLDQATRLVQTKSVREPLFSRGTYQIEVVEKGKKFFPFLQLEEDGTLKDFFCTCSVSEQGHGCPHLAAAFLRIFQGHKEPLHVRFKVSLWNRLFQMAARRHGYDSEVLKKQKNGVYSADSETKKQLFLIEAKEEKAIRRLSSMIQMKEIDTEETSLKLSNWSSEEIQEFREGRGAHGLRYEISFWSDLAKWLMYFVDEGDPYHIEYKGTPVPQQILIKFPQLEIHFYVAEVNWPWLIPGLSTVRSSLEVFDFEKDAFESVEYNEEKQEIFVLYKQRSWESSPHVAGYQLGDWYYVENKGFYRKRKSQFIQEEKFTAEGISAFLSAEGERLESFLPIHVETLSFQYKISLNSQDELQITAYLWEPGDLQDSRAACFNPWIYLPQKGFYRVEEWLFDGKEKIVKKQDMADFINRHRLFLQNFPGFHTHLGSIESHLVYRLTPEKDLVFEAELSFPQEYEDIRHFDEWVYLRGQGFYLKKENRTSLPIHPGLRIACSEISGFIHSYKEALEPVHHFFVSTPILLKAGLRIDLNADESIQVSPEFKYAPGVEPDSIQVFGDYLYIEGQGFYEVPYSFRLPPRFQEQVVIERSQEASFLTYDLSALQPWIMSVDPRLQVPQNLKLKIRRVMPNRRAKIKEWLVDLVYESEKGQVTPISIWEAFHEKKKYLFSSAGLIFLNKPRLHWIRQLSKRRLDRKKGYVKLNMLEWLRLSIFEPIEPPRGQDKESQEIRCFLEEASRMETDQEINLSGLNATLRPYQEEGVRWLWFLYTYGLSGLLCDDMGLGKTHQAMALLSAVENKDPDRRHKYLVVCPTSVIYHWQELLKRFLPQLRVHTYYGLERSLDSFDKESDLLLTSYGILRTGKDNLKTIFFEVAIFDEIQIAKNQASQTHLALAGIRAQMRLGLTGTPIENRIRELKALFDVVLPLYMPSETVFREIFIQPIEKENDEEKKTLLNRLIKPFVLRRKKSDVLTDLPEKIEEISYCDLSEEQKRLYQEVASRMKETLYQDLKNKTVPISYIHVFSALTKLKRICDHPSLISGDIKNYSSYQSGKWDLFIEILYEARQSGQKVVVFSQYLEMLRIIELYLKKKGIGYASLTGSTKDRREPLRRFREDPKCEVFVASLLAAGVGIDLTVASIVIHYDRWWNPAKENQATDRVHRIGQNRGVQVFKLVTKNTIEEHVHRLIEKKKGLLEEIVGAEDQITILTREEILEIFETMFQNESDR